MTNANPDAESANRSRLTSDQMLDKFRDSLQAELEELEGSCGRPLASLAALMRIRSDAATTVTAVMAHGALLREPFPIYEALECARAMLKPVRWRYLQEAAQSLGRADFEALERRAVSIEELLEGMEAHAGGRMVLVRGFPSWLSLRDAFQNELEKFELWAITIEGTAPPPPLSLREREILQCLSERPIIARDIADRICSSEGSVRNIIAKLRAPFDIRTRHGVGYYIDPDNRKIREALSNGTGDDEVTMA